MEIQQQVDGVDERPQFAGAAAFAGAVVAQRLVLPEPVHVLVRPSRGEGVRLVIKVVGVEVDEGEGQLARQGAHLVAKQPVERDGAAQLVAMHHRRDRHMRPGAATVECGHAANAGVAGKVGRDVGLFQFERKLVVHA